MMTRVWYSPRHRIKSRKGNPTDIYFIVYNNRTAKNELVERTGGRSLPVWKQYLRSS